MQLHRGSAATVRAGSSSHGSRHGIVRELHAVVVLEQRFQGGVDARVVLGADPQQAPRIRRAQFAVLDDRPAVLDDVAGRGEHRLAIGAVVVDRDVGVGAHAEVALVAQPEQPRRPGARDDRDLLQRVLAIEVVEQDGALHRPAVHAPDLLVAEVAVHQQADQARVAEERTAVGVIGRQHEPPRVAAEQEQLEADPPLQRVHVVALAVGERHDPAAGLGLGVGVDPAAVGDLGQDRRDRSVSGHRRRRPEHHLADVGADLRVRAEVLGELRRPRTRSPAGLSAVGVELEVGEVGAAAVERAQRVERRAVVTGHAEVVAVDVHRVRQPELVDRGRDRLDHAPRRDAGALVVERGDVGVVALEHLDAAGIDELDAIAAGRLQVPRDRLADASRIVADEAEDRQVVAHQHQEGGVDDGRVAQLGERVARRERRRGGVDHGRVAEQRVAVAGGERRGDGAAGAGAGDRGPLQRCRRDAPRARACARR